MAITKLLNSTAIVLAIQTIWQGLNIVGILLHDANWKILVQSLAYCKAQLRSM